MYICIYVYMHICIYIYMYIRHRASAPGRVGLHPRALLCIRRQHSTAQHSTAQPLHFSAGRAESSQSCAQSTGTAQPSPSEHCRALPRRALHPAQQNTVQSPAEHPEPCSEQHCTQPSRALSRAQQSTQSPAQSIALKGPAPRFPPASAASRRPSS